MAGRPLRRSRTDVPKYETRAGWWRREIDTAGTPQEQWRQVQRWFAASAARASEADRNRAYCEASRMLAEVAARLEGARIDHVA